MIRRELTPVVECLIILACLVLETINRVIRSKGAEL